MIKTNVKVVEKKLIKTHYLVMVYRNLIYINFFKTPIINLRFHYTKASKSNHQVLHFD